MMFAFSQSILCLFFFLLCFDVAMSLYSIILLTLCHKLNFLTFALWPLSKEVMSYCNSYTGEIDCVGNENSIIRVCSGGNGQ